MYRRCGARVNAAPRVRRRAYGGMMLPHAFERVDEWAGAWAHTGALVLLLDFDGTLAPIVAHPDRATIPARTRAALSALLEITGVEAAIVSGRALADARSRARIERIGYAGNHGMEIEAHGVTRLHPDALAARPALGRVAERLVPVLSALPGAWLEDKGLTLSVHYRLAPPECVPEVREAVRAAAADDGTLRVTEGKMVLEVRPRTDWHKGRAVEFLLERMRPPAGAPVLYLGDDRTDEDAFAVLATRGAGAAGVLVSEPLPEHTAATAYLRSPDEVGVLFERLARERMAR